MLLGGALLVLVGLSWLPLEGTWGPFRIRRVSPLAGATAVGRVPAPGPDRISAVADPGPESAASRPVPGPKAGTRGTSRPAGRRTAGGQPIEFFSGERFPRFGQALSDLGTGRDIVRIAYFGDSLVEGDLMVGDLRNEFQKTFGGGGVGFLPITSEVARFRPTVGHTYSGGWQVSTVLDRKPAVPLGFGGQVWAPPCTPTGCSGWVEYRAESRLQALVSFRGLRVYAGRVPPGATITAAPDSGPEQRVGLTPGDALQEAIFAFDPPARTVRLTVWSPGPLNLYGAAWDEVQGVVVDNLALRRHSGLGLAAIPAEALRAADRLRHYDLVVLHFGTNVANPESNMGKWYEAGMTKALKHLRAALPDSDFLVISVADRSFNQDGTFATIPTIPSLVAHQRRAAENTGAAFWDLFTAMGGANAMVAWVNHTPPLASLDYTHFSHVGGRRVAKALFRALIDATPAREAHATR